MIPEDRSPGGGGEQQVYELVESMARGRGGCVVVEQRRSSGWPAVPTEVHTMPARRRAEVRQEELLPALDEARAAG